MGQDVFVVRALNQDDLQWLLELSGQVGFGFSSLPNNRDYIEKRVDTVVKSFAEKIPKDERILLFVLEHAKTKQRIGLCGLDLSIGHNQLFYNFRIDTEEQTTDYNNIAVTHKLLRVAFDFQTATELISFWIDPAFRDQGLGKPLSFSRFLFVAQHLDWFGESLIAEVRGSLDIHGNSPFWEAVGRPFFTMDFDTADQLTYIDHKQFIADLIAKQPIYVDLLSPDAQAVIGVEHEEAAGARLLLESQGFEYTEHIDIFDGGPVLSCKTEHILSVKNSKQAVIQEVVAEITNGVSVLIYNCLLDAKFTFGEVEIVNEGSIKINNTMADLLQIKPKAPVRYLIL